MKPLLLSLIVLVSLVSACKRSTEGTVDRLMGRIRAELPRGWTVAYDKEYACLEVSREEKVSFAGEKPPQWQMSYMFRVTDLISAAEYRRRSAETTKTQAELAELYRELVKMNMDRKFNSFRPRTEEERAAVERYEALRDSLDPPPEFYFEDVSVTWAFGARRNPATDISWPDLGDEATRKECDGVKVKVVGVLSRYEEEKEKPDAK